MPSAMATPAVEIKICLPRMVCYAIYNIFHGWCLRRKVTENVPRNTIVGASNRQIYRAANSRQI
jgi:hypothetical protein